MSFFFLKNPNCLDFMLDPKQESLDKPETLQIREKEGRSNSRLCKKRDGTWFIKCGDIKMDLTNIKIKSMKVVEKEEKGGKIIGFVTKKWFLKANEKLRDLKK